MYPTAMSANASADAEARPTVTGLVLTYNGERLLKKCLDSLGFCDEILVVDSHSTDRTRDIAEALGARVLVRAWEGPGPQFAYALEQISTDWVLSLDQDESLDPALGDAVKAVLANPDTTLAGYYLSRRSWYFDRFLKHSGWYPDRLLRLWRAGRMRVTVSGAHYHFLPQGPTADLHGGDIVHYPYTSFAEHLHKVDSYAQQGADDLRAKGRPGGVLPALTHGLGRFAKIYLVKRGFLDGRAGFLNAVHGAFYAFLKYARAAETVPWPGSVDTSSDRSADQSGE